MIASLPMYDWPELQPATDAFWSVLQEELARERIGAPASLDRTLPMTSVWSHPSLTVSMCCGRHVADRRIGHAEPVASPVWEVTGCTDGTYTSAIVVRAGEDTRPLADLARRPVINGWDSWSGQRVFCHWLSDQGIGAGQALESGSHRASLQALRDARADIAAIDALCLHLATDLGETDGLTVLGWTAPAPTTPFIVGAPLHPQRRAIQEALARAIDAPESQPLKTRTGLAGIVPRRGADFAPMGQRHSAQT